MIVLDELIQDCYDALKPQIKENPKLGDLLKMIELRRKLRPTDADQRALWKKLEQARKDVLSPKPNEASPKSTDNNSGAKQ